MMDANRTIGNKNVFPDNGFDFLMSYEIAPGTPKI